MATNLVCGTMASAGRYLYQNIRRGTVHFLLGGIFALLGMIHACVPIPSPIRTFNPTTLTAVTTFMEEETIRKANATGRVMKGTPMKRVASKPSARDGNDEKKMIKKRYRDQLFRGVVIRTTGLPRVFQDFAKWMFDNKYHSKRRKCYAPGAVFACFWRGSCGYPV